MDLFTHCAHREMERDMESGYREVERDMKERVAKGYRMLLEAAILETSMEVLQDDPAILDQVMWECRGKDNPLHVGALHGNVNFVKEILSRISRKRELIRELNSEGQSPLHLASARGHVDVVREILSQDACLTRELNSEGQSPLHLASARGHVDVVREILSQDADACLTRELNSEGQSPLHLASARGHVEVVREILRKDADACFIRDQDGMIPLHLAAINGRVEVLEVLVKAEKITAFILTKSGEPIMHLCANNNKFKALKKLIGLVEQKDRLLKLKDRNNNTILHLLSAKGNYKVIKSLVPNTVVREVLNAENMDGIRPLDVAGADGSLWGGSMTLSLLIASGAKRGRNNSQSVSRLPIGKQIEGNEDSRFAEALMVVAVLTITVAFQTRLNPPGVWQETALHNATLPNAARPKQVLHYAGRPIMSYVSSIFYTLFAISNDVTLTLSMYVIQLLLVGYLTKSTTMVLNFAANLAAGSLLSMSITYFAWTVSISSRKLLYLTGVLVYQTMVPYVILLLTNLCGGFGSRNN